MSLAKAKELKAALSKTDKAQIRKVAKLIKAELDFESFVGSIESELAWCWHHIKAVVKEEAKVAE